MQPGCQVMAASEGGVRLQAGQGGPSANDDGSLVVDPDTRRRPLPEFSGGWWRISVVEFGHPVVRCEVQGRRAAGFGYLVVQRKGEGWRVVDFGRHRTSGIFSNFSRSGFLAWGFGFFGELASGYGVMSVCRKLIPKCLN